MCLSILYYATGGEAERIVLWPLGGYVVLGRTEGVSVMEDFWVALAGPLTHIPMGAFWFGIYGIFESYKDYQFEADASWDFDKLSTWDGFLATMAEQAMFLNAGLFIFNVFVPAYPLDGGRILCALFVSCCCCSITCAAYSTALIALALAAAMIFFAVYDLFIDDNDDADGGAPLILLMIGVWIGVNSLDLLRHAWQGRAVEHVLFNKQCYRRRAGMNDDGSSPFGDVPPPAGDSQQLSRRELRQQQKESKRQAKEAKRQGSGVNRNDNDDSEEPTHTMPIVGNPEVPPQHIDVELSPAGAGTSWTTFNAPAEPVSEPPPDLEGSGKKKSGLGSLFRKKSRPSQSQNDDDFVV